jgi:starch phosphorylase
MNALGCVYRYLELKKMSPADRKKAVPRVSIFAGKAAPGYYTASASRSTSMREHIMIGCAELIIRLINAISKTVNADKDIGDAFQVVFLPDYSVSLAEVRLPIGSITRVPTQGPDHYPCI